MSRNRRIAAGIISASLAATSVQAGGFAEPVMEAEIIVAETAATTAGGVIVPLLLLLLIAAVAASNGGGGGTPVPGPGIIPPGLGPA